MFCDDEIGDIDLVWGSRDENAGLDHIINKHVGKGKDYSTIDEARRVIEEAISNGVKIKNNKDKAIFEHEGNRVVVRKTSETKLLVHWWMPKRNG